MPYKDFEEFKEKIRPYYGKGHYSKNMKLVQFIEEKERKKRSK